MVADCQFVTFDDKLWQKYFNIWPSAALSVLAAIVIKFVFVFVLLKQFCVNFWQCNSFFSHSWNGVKEAFF